MLFAAVILGNLLFIILNATNPSNVIGTLSIIFASLAFLGLYIGNVCVTASTFNFITKDKQNYMMKLTPTPAWKMLLGSIIPSVVLDVLAFLIGVTFVVAHSITMYGNANIDAMRMDPATIYVFVILTLLYTILITMGLFWHALTKTVLMRVPLSGFIGLVITILLVAATSFINTVMLPFGQLQRIGPFFTILIENITHLQFSVVALVFLLQAAILFFVTAYLLDRRA